MIIGLRQLRRLLKVLLISENTVTLSKGRAQERLTISLHLRSYCNVKREELYTAEQYLTVFPGAQWSLGLNFEVGSSLAPHFSQFREAPYGLLKSSNDRILIVNGICFLKEEKEQKKTPSNQSISLASPSIAQFSSRLHQLFSIVSSPKSRLFFDVTQDG